MGRQLDVFEFQETAFLVGSDPVTCIVAISALDGLMTLAEIDEAFSGYASYRQSPWMRRYVGVWGRKNCQRFRRFLRERGADVVMHRDRPSRIRLTSYMTRGKRNRVRSLRELGS